MDGVTERLARVATKRTCRLTHRGRKSGRPFEVTIWFLVVVTEASEVTEVVRLLKEKYWLSRPYLWLKKRPDGVFRVQFKS